MFNILQYYNKNNENNENKIKYFRYILCIQKKISILIIQYLLSIKTKFANNFLNNDKQTYNHK